MTALALIVYIFIIAPISIAWSGYALSILWGWFFVPAFGAPSLSVPGAIGVALVVSYMTAQIKTSNKDECGAHEEILREVVIALFRPAMALLFGWIVTKFM